MTQNMLITGASRGIGAATALLAAKSQWNVCVNYHRNEQAAQDIADKIKARGLKSIAVQADVSKEADIVRLFAQFDKNFGSLDALVNNAGILETQMRLEEMDMARLSRVFTTNVCGSFLCAREAVIRMSTKRGGKGGAIVNLSSMAARLGSPNEYVDYAATKGAIDTMTIGLAREVADEGIRVNGVRPGLIDTEIHASGGDPDRLQRLCDTVPMKSIGTPQEVAKAILWLASHEASYTTGSFIDISGGR